MFHYQQNWLNSIDDWRFSSFDVSIKNVHLHLVLWCSSHSNKNYPAPGYHVLWCFSSTKSEYNRLTYKLIDSRFTTSSYVICKMWLSRPNGSGMHHFAIMHDTNDIINVTTAGPIQKTLGLSLTSDMEDKRSPWISNGNFL